MTIEKKPLGSAHETGSTQRAKTPRETPPPEIFAELRRGVLGQDEALRFAAVAVYKHTTGEVPGNILLIGNSGTGKTTIMNNIQRLYNEVPTYHTFRAMTIINANLLVDSDRMEFRADRLLAAVEQRARAVIGHPPSAEELKQTMQRATICIDEVDKMSSVVAGKPNPIGVVLQQGLLTLMEDEVITYRTHVTVDDKEEVTAINVSTGGMMFICGGAFEGLYDQVYYRVINPGSGERLKSTAVRTADGQVRIEERFALADFFRVEDLFAYGMVPQFIARFDNVVILRDLSMEVLKEILLTAYDSPFVRSRRFFRIMDIDLEIDNLAAALIAEEAERHSRTGARALRSIFGRIINQFEFDPASEGKLEEREGARKLVVGPDLVRRCLRL